MARIASGTPGQDATEAGTPPGNLHTLKGKATDEPHPAAGMTEAIDRATAAVGHDDGAR